MERGRGVVRGGSIGGAALLALASPLACASAAATEVGVSHASVGMRRSSYPIPARGPLVFGTELRPLAELRATVREHLAEVQACHREGLAVTPEAEGRIVVRFVVAPTGRVMASAVSARNYPVPRVAECLAVAVRRWRFPASDRYNVVTVNYPFLLLPPLVTARGARVP